MVDKGARNLIFLGRSGEDKPEAASMIKRFRSNGVTVNVIKGDITSEEDVQKAVQSVDIPIFGVVQGVMALDVRHPVCCVDSAERVLGSSILQSQRFKLGICHSAKGKRYLESAQCCRLPTARLLRHAWKHIRNDRCSYAKQLLCWQHILRVLFSIPS